MNTRRPHRLILCNDGNAIAGPTREAPLGEQGLVELAIDPLRDTMVDTLYWQLGTDPYFGTPTHRLTDHYSHDTAVGPRWGAGTERFATASEWRVYENTRELIETGTDPPAVLVEHGHRAGLQVFLSMRVNDVHDRNLPGGLDDPLMSPMKRGNRDWILGGDGLRQTACDFAVPAVRDYKLALAEEAIDRYDLDGLDWDFCRVPVFFQPGQVGRGTALMTDLVGRLKAALARKSERAGRPVLFSARVPGSLDAALAAGLDVRTWIERGLIDVVVVGHATGSRFRLPVEEYVAAARGTDVEVIAQNLGLFMQPRPHWAGLLFGERDYYSTEMCRAVAAVHHRAGAHGLYLFNNHYLAVTRDAGYDRQPWREIADPALIARRDKHYLVDQQETAGGPLPIALQRPGDRAELRIDVADDPADGGQATLRLLIEQLTAPDEVAVELNGAALDPDRARRRIHFNDAWLDLDVTGHLRQGWNALSVRVVARNDRVGCPLSLASVEVLVRYP